MHGLIFVTWEKYLSERFPGAVFNTYRDALAGKAPSSLLASRVYDDDLLLAGVAAASRITRLPVETLLREYGYYFIINGLTRHLCSYILTQVHGARDLLLAMHDAHEQMSRLPESLSPPLFQYRTQTGKTNELGLLYDSPRKLCSVLLGAIEGAAERYGEQVQIVEQMCMNRGDSVCYFNVHFITSATGHLEAQEQIEHQQAKQQFARFILLLLPEEGGFTLSEVQKAVVMRGMNKDSARPALRTRCQAESLLY